MIYLLFGICLRIIWVGVKKAEAIFLSQRGSYTSGNVIEFCVCNLFPLSLPLQVHKWGVRFGREKEQNITKAFTQEHASGYFKTI